MDETIIGTIDLSTVEESFLESIGTVNLKKKAGVCTVKVKGNEGEIPHLHIENGKGFVCHVCLYEPLYFEHKRGESKLTPDQKARIQSFLLDQHDPELPDTNWQFAVEDWMKKNDQDGKKLERYLKNRGLDGTMPNYTTLDNSKDGTIHAPKR